MGVKILSDTGYLITVVNFGTNWTDQGAVFARYRAITGVSEMIELSL